MIICGMTRGSPAAVFNGGGGRVHKIDCDKNHDDHDASLMSTDVNRPGAGRSSLKHEHFMQYL
jgi:hypothetical protein